MALSIVIILRITATIVTFGNLPASWRRRWNRLSTGFQLLALIAAMKRTWRTCERPPQCTVMNQPPSPLTMLFSRHTKRRQFITLLGGAAAWPMAARAQRPGRMYKIGYLSPSSRQLVSPALLDALRDLGWIEGKNVTFEYRFADNRLERLPALAAELVRLNVDVILTAGTLGALAAKQATSTIPIVMTAAGDPLGSGLVASLARPGGNVTGMSLMVPDIGGKRLELLKELRPRLARVAVIWNAANPYPAVVFNETQTAGRILAIEVQS